MHGGMRYMKKAIIIFLLIGTLAGSAFAELTFSGDVYIGVQLRNAPGADESITTDHRNYFAPEFNLSATVSRENYGARLVTRAEGTSFTIRGIYGWVDFFDNSLRLSMGRFSDGMWVIRLDSDLSELSMDGNITGFRFAYSTPLPGLSVGAVFRADRHNMEEFFQQMIFGATYVSPFFNAVFAYDLGQNVRTLFGINFPTFHFLGLPDLSLGFKLLANNLATWDSTPALTSGSLSMYQRIGYRISWPVSVSLIASQTISGAPEIEYTTLMFGPGITYRNRLAPSLTGSLRLLIDSPDHFATTNLTLRPAIEKSLAGPALFYVQYEWRLPDVGSSNPMDRAVHTFGFGIEIRAF